MRYANTLNAFADSDVGVLGFTANDQTPRALAITPYLLGGQPVVTTTLAYLTKAKMLRNRPAAALFAGGVHVSGDVKLQLRQDPSWFNANLRQAESAKYPPARSLLAVPQHEKLFWWYVGRVTMTFDSPTITTPGGADRVTVTSVVDGRVRITPLSDDQPTAGDLITLPSTVPDGPACLLIHHETERMAELLSLTLRGHVCAGLLHVTSRHGSLVPQHPGLIAQLRALRQAGRLARANRPAIDTWDSAHHR